MQFVSVSRGKKNTKIAVRNVLNNENRGEQAT